MYAVVGSFALLALSVKVMERYLTRKPSEACDNLVKARKRHFDSRWRANIASCFETLLHVVPMSKRAIKKQSKANILEATAQHLEFLERTIVLLLQEKAKKLGIQDSYVWCANEIEQLKASFIVKESSRPRKPTKGRQRNRLTRVKNRNKKLDVANAADYLERAEKTKPLDESKSMQRVIEVHVSEGLCCKEEMFGSDDEAIQSVRSSEVTPKITPMEAFKIPKKVRKFSHPVTAHKSRRSLIEQLDSLENESFPMKIIRSPVKQSSSDERLLILDESMDPWLSNRLVLRVENDRPNPDEVPQEDQFAEQVEFLGQNSPLFGQELQHLLSNC